MSGEDYDYEYEATRDRWQNLKTSLACILATGTVLALVFLTEQAIFATSGHRHIWLSIFS